MVSADSENVNSFAILYELPVKCKQFAQEDAKLALKRKQFSHKILKLALYSFLWKLSNSHFTVFSGNCQTGRKTQQSAQKMLNWHENENMLSKKFDEIRRDMLSLVYRGPEKKKDFGFGGF